MGDERKRNKIKEKERNAREIKGKRQGRKGNKIKGEERK